MRTTEDELFDDVKYWRAEADRLREMLARADEAMNQLMIWLPSGYAPESKANAIRLAREARREIASLNQQPGKHE